MYTAHMIYILLQHILITLNYWHQTHVTLQHQFTPTGTPTSMFSKFRVWQNLFGKLQPIPVLLLLITFLSKHTKIHY